VLGPLGARLAYPHKAHAHSSKMSAVLKRELCRVSKSI
jgi:hypothetical protein